jgi:hypothetical protein
VANWPGAPWAGTTGIPRPVCGKAGPSVAGGRVAFPSGLAKSPTSIWRHRLPEESKSGRAPWDVKEPPESSELRRQGWAGMSTVSPVTRLAAGGRMAGSSSSVSAEGGGAPPSPPPAAGAASAGGEEIGRRAGGFAAGAGREEGAGGASASCGPGGEDGVSSGAGEASASSGPGGEAGVSSGAGGEEGAAGAAALAGGAAPGLSGLAGGAAPGGGGAVPAPVTGAEGGRTAGGAGGVTPGLPICGAAGGTGASGLRAGGTAAPPAGPPGAGAESGTGLPVWGAGGAASVPGRRGAPVSCKEGASASEKSEVRSLSAASWAQSGPAARMSATGSDMRERRIDGRRVLAMMLFACPAGGILCNVSGVSPATATPAQGGDPRPGPGCRDGGIRRRRGERPQAALTHALCHTGRNYPHRFPGRRGAAGRGLRRGIPAPPPAKRAAAR